MVQKTLEHTTCLTKLEDRLPLRRHIKSQFQQLSIPRLHEMYTTDTMLANIPSYEGYNAAQIYAGEKSGRKEVYGLRTEAQAHHAMEEFIREVGAPYCLHSDNAKAETSRICNDLTRRYAIKQTTSESYYPWQDSLERSIQDVKKGMEIMLDRTRADPRLWFKAMECAVFVLICWQGKATS